MLKAIRELLESTLRNDDHSKHTLEIAAAALLVEIGRSDAHWSPLEREFVGQAIRKHFGMSSDEADLVLVAAESAVEDAVSLTDFTQMLKDRLSLPERITIVELLWRVANADTTIDKYEEYFVRKISDLLYVPHRDYIQAKLRVLDVSSERQEGD